MAEPKSYFILFRKGWIGNPEYTQAPMSHITDLENAQVKCNEYTQLFRKMYEDTGLKPYDIITVETFTSEGLKPVYAQYISLVGNKKKEQGLTFKDLKSLIAEAEKDYGNIDDYNIACVDATGNLGVSWVAHSMDYLEVDTHNKVIDIGFYK